MEPGDSFGRYEVLRTLGAGGMGEILLARQPGMAGVRRRVVIKKILSHLAKDPDFIDRFMDEARLAAGLNHGNIVQIYEAGEINGEYFMAMEYVDGLDLKELLVELRANDRRIPEPVALYILVEIAKALSYAHQKKDEDGRPLGIVHRDVSPANLLLSRDGQVKLTDFGVAKARSRLSMSLPGTLHGKVYYMSPEQVQGEDVDLRSDVFSLASVAYEVLSGHRPFDGDSDVAVIERVRRCEPIALSQAAPWVSASLSAVVMKGLCRATSGRYQSMDEFSASLTEYMLSTHSMVSAKALSEFLGKELKKTVAVQQTSSLDEIAAGLLGEREAILLEGDGAEDSSRTKTVVPGGDSGNAQAGKPRHRGVALSVTVASTLVAGALVAGLLLLTNDQTDANPLSDADVPATTDLAMIALAPIDAWSRDDFDLAPDDIIHDSESNDLFNADSGLAETHRQALPPNSESAKPESADTDRASGQAPAPLDRLAPQNRQARLDSRPSGADAFDGTVRIGRTPLWVAVPEEGEKVYTLRHPYRAPRQVVVRPDSLKSLTILLNGGVGRLKFRFFPADSGVFIDSQPITTGSNLVDIELAEGDHEVIVKSGSGQTFRKKVQIGADSVVNLGTVELETVGSALRPTKDPEKEGP